MQCLKYCITPTLLFTMSKLYFLCIFFLSINKFYGQNPYILSLEDDHVDYISDVVLKNQLYYLLKVSLFNLEQPADNDFYTDLITANFKGEIIEKYKLTNDLIKYFRILKIQDENIFLVGRLKSDSCLSKLLISKLNLITHELTHLSSYDFCDIRILNIKIVKGLNDKTLIAFYDNPTYKTTFISVDENYNLTWSFQSTATSAALSVDFSLKGYLIGSWQLFDFYDADFNFRKQRFTDEDIFAYQETHFPFSNHLLLVQTKKNSGPDEGVQVRFIDSNLVVKKKIVITPPHFFQGDRNLPYFGGLDVQSENEIWASSFYYSRNEQFVIDTSFYSISKLDSNLNVICQHFLGYDGYYRIFGLRAFESGGAIVFGSRLRDGHEVNEGEDIYAIRVGENCELPVTAIEDPLQLVSISVYPNPTINSLTFDVHGFDPASLRVEIFNAEGIVLFTVKDLSHEIEIKDLPAGQYFYRILQKEKVLGVGPWVKL